MNKVILMGRLTREPDIRYSNNNGDQLCIARFTLAVDRRAKKDETDFISCVAFGKLGEFFEQYVRKGTKLAITGRIQTGSYEKDGQKVYTTDVVVEEAEFAESKKAESGEESKPADEGFMDIPKDMEPLFKKRG